MAKFMVTYIRYENNAIEQKNGFKTENAAREWIEKQETTIKPLKLLVWDKDIDCYSTIKTFNTNYDNASATTVFKTVFCA